MKNIKSVGKTKEEKDRCFKENKIILDYAYCLGKGFFVKEQLAAIITVISHVPPKKLEAMIRDLCENGLLIQKQATSTKTSVYVMTGYALAKYMRCSSQNASTIKLNNHKIWTNLFRMEFIIREVLPKAAGKIHSCRELKEWLESRFVDILRAANQEDTFRLYYKFYQQYPIKNKEKAQGEFISDYFACAAEYHDYLLHFQNKAHIAEHYKGYEKYKYQKQENQVLYGKTTDKNRYCFNFSQMSAQGFFIQSLLEGQKMKMGLFDVYKNIQLGKIYQNGIYILFMLQRYLGFVPELRLTVYVRDESTKKRLEREESQRAYHYLERASSDHDRRTDFFYELGVPAWQGKLKVEYKEYNLIRKYHL